MDVDKLRTALCHTTAGNMRKDLRRLAQDALERHLDKTKLEFAMQTSRLVGTGPKQINPAHTHSGLTGSLDLVTLAMLCEADADGTIRQLIGDMLDAIKAPLKYGVTTSSRKSKTGYLFGRHKEWDEDNLARLINRATDNTGIFKEPPHMEEKRTFPTNPTDALSIMVAVHTKYPKASKQEVLEAIGDTHEWRDESDTSAFNAAKTIFLDDDCDFDYETYKSGLDYDSRRAIRRSTRVAFDYLTEKQAIIDTTFDEMFPAKPSALRVPDAAQATMIDAVLQTQGLPPIGELIATINKETDKVMELTIKAAEQDKQLADARKAASKVSLAPVETKAISSGPTTIPAGKMELANAATLFGIEGSSAALFDFEVPKWSWDGDHPHVPMRDVDYIFRPEELLRCLFAIMTNQRAYLYGHTGTGKTTLVEQIAAVLMWPFMRVNFDSEITRMDLIGRDVLTTEDGVTVSQFAEGILPQAMSGPYLLCCDEIDFVRPDVAYVMQRALEGNGLLLTEDGGRLIKPDPMFRMFATGNTQGQGDEHGMYAGARPQSLALLDRFTVWSQVDYLSANERSKLIKRKVPSLDDAHHKVITQYVDEHLAAFKSAKIMQPMSPRGMIALASAVSVFASMTSGKESQQALKRAFDTVILDRASSTDRAVMSGIVDRVMM